MAKTNTIRSNSLQTNSVRLNGVEGLRRVSLQAGEIPDIPPTYTLSASVTNGKVSATRNGSAVTLPFTANEGDTIVLEVTPNDGYAFEGWADGNTDNPRTITMNADVVLSAQCVEVVQPPVGNYIQFEDKAVEAICVANWSSDGIGLTEEDAAKVTSLGAVFKGNTEITSFDELKYFTKVTTLGNDAFSDCSALTSIDARNITNIEIGVFARCTALKRFEARKATTIGYGAFLNSGVKEVIIPQVTEIPNCAWDLGIIRFSECETIEVGDGLTRIGDQAIREATKLKNFTIPASVTYIGVGAFYYCTSLEWIKVLASVPCEISGDAVFAGTSCLIYVPDASLEAYKTATNWVSYADRIHPLSEIEGGAYGLVSDGNAYIVTDYYPNTYDNVEVEFERPSSTTLQLLLGSRESLSYKNLFVAAINPSSGGGGYVDRFYSNSTPPYTVTNGRNNIKLQLSSDNEGRLVKDLFMHNDKLVNTFNRSFEPTEYVMPYPLVVFGSNQMNSSAIDTRIFKGTIYFVKITDARSGEVKLYLQPRVVDGVAGMMDTISGTFYTNSNTKGTFIVE